MSREDSVEDYSVGEGDTSQEPTNTEAVVETHQGQTSALGESLLLLLADE